MRDGFFRKTKQRFAATLIAVDVALGFCKPIGFLLGVALGIGAIAAPATAQLKLAVQPDFLVSAHYQDIGGDTSTELADPQDKPALLPQPKELVWNKGFFLLSQCRTILVTQPALHQEAATLKAMLAALGYEADMKTTVPLREKYIELRLVDTDIPPPQYSNENGSEAYRLTVSADRILITGKTPHAIFNGLQTLYQLMGNGHRVNACEIRDWPSFSWRGFMIDVGRNYASMNMLKEIIGVMGQYKFNVFHFHATEDIAWRIAVRQYPQLTAPENMLRDKGLYYSQREIQELIDFCRDRHIEFVPEIDMPGHSAAFTRAMGADMQSDTGGRYLRNILKELLETYEVPFVHIGADEVEIVNPNFVPDMTEYIESFGRRVIGWQPGGNFTDNTIRQLWMGGEQPHAPGKPTRFIDSRHLYLNHMDPLESVVTMYNRRIGGVAAEDSAVWGGTLCLWHDRAVACGDDVLKMNPVYPGMLAFAERSWAGGGQHEWVANISEGDEEGFAAFEARLLHHRQLNFQDKPFPYVRQSHLRWKLYGPYDNGGNLDKVFLPEQQPGQEFPDRLPGKPSGEAVGGTVVLRHWWAPQIKGAIDQPAENSTWYATTSLWAEEAGEKEFWIGFNNLSRSMPTDSPPAGAWDNKGSEVWVNGEKIRPPDWRRPGQKGHYEIPLYDEGYEYRAPTRIYLRAGWNRVWVKAPVGGFKGPDWQNPVKWMFSFAPLDHTLDRTLEPPNN